MGPTKEAILERLRRVKGPDLQSNIVDLGLVSEVLVKDGRVSFSITVPAQRAAELEPLRQAADHAVRELAGAYYGMGVTGIAGPGGGSAEKPVGLVYIALSTPDGVTAKKNLFTGSRADVRYRTTQAALDMLRQAILSQAPRDTRPDG